MKIKDSLIGIIILTIFAYFFLATMDYFSDLNIEEFCTEKGFTDYYGYGGEINGKITIEYMFYKCFNYDIDKEKCIVKEGDCKMFTIEEIKEWNKNHEKFWSLND